MTDQSDPGDDPTDDSGDDPAPDEPRDPASGESRGPASNEPRSPRSTGDRGGKDGEILEEETIEDAAVEDVDEVLEEVEHKRSLGGWAAVAVTVIAITFSAFQMWIAARGFTFEATVPFVGTVRLADLQLLQLNAIHVTFGLVLAFLMFPASTGEGRVARAAARIPAATRSQFGEESPVTAAVDRVRALFGWAIVDEKRHRVSPVDVVLIALSLLPPFYMLTEFEEIQNTLRLFGVQAGRPLPEVYPALEPLAVGPLADTSWAFVMGVLAIVLVIEATRRALGFLLMSLVTVFIAYARLGHHIPRSTDTGLAPVDVLFDWVGILAITEKSWASIVRDMWYNTEAGILGVPVTVSVRFIFIFILFGAFLEMSGAGKWFIDLAYSATGTRRGGPAKASVVSSGFMGMLSGSSVANTVTTGAFTIPLMKRSGYTPEFSGAVESSVSSGGQILPPVMGAAAFLIVEFTGTPYRVVIVAAALPALAFFFGMWVMVHFEAVRRGVGGVPRAELPDIWPQLRRGWFYFFPVLLLLYFLVIARLSINRSGWFTIVATVALIALVAAYDERTRVPLLAAFALLTLASVATQLLAGESFVAYLQGARGSSAGLQEAIVSTLVGSLGVGAILLGIAVMVLRPRMDSPVLDLNDDVTESIDAFDERTGLSLGATQPGRFAGFVLKSMESGAKTATIVVVAVAAAGVIPGVISVTGLGPNLTRLVIVASRESFILLLVFAAISAVILGMGMPTTVMYIILVSVLGGALQEFGVALLLAHLFVLYFGLMADVTPPVMVAAYAASGVAKSEPFATGKLAFLLSLNKITVPFAFVLYPGIALISPTDNPREVTLLGVAELTDPGFVIPDVLIPIVGMFAGVYALGVAIIGYQYGPVSRSGRSLYSLVSLLLMVPALVLLFVEGLLGLAGVTVTLDTLTFDLLLRLVGAILFVVLTTRNRRTATAAGERESEQDAATLQPSDT
jgi:TRAP transporter 4TM/12TM fusion protein